MRRRYVIDDGAASLVTVSPSRSRSEFLPTPLASSFFKADPGGLSQRPRLIGSAYVLRAQRSRVSQAKLRQHRTALRASAFGKSGPALLYFLR